MKRVFLGAMMLLAIQIGALGLYDEIIRDSIRATLIMFNACFLFGLSLTGFVEEVRRAAGQAERGQ